jgi:hypothetical protein
MSRFPSCFSSFIRFYLLFAAIDTTFLLRRDWRHQRRSLPVAAMNGEIRETRVLTDSVAHTGPSVKPKPHVTADIAWGHDQRAKNLPNSPAVGIHVLVFCGLPHKVARERTEKSRIAENVHFICV